MTIPTLIDAEVPTGLQRKGVCHAKPFAPDVKGSCASKDWRRGNTPAAQLSVGEVVADKQGPLNSMAAEAGVHSSPFSKLHS